MSYQNIIVETKGRVGIIRLNRPQALNALNRALIAELIQAIDAFEADDGIGCLLITGNDKAFAAGADIKEMADKTFIEAYLGNFCADWDRAARARKPIVAAVAGFALGGGCELAMHCDIIIAADNAKFGQPEIKLGVIPGIGGTQRLTRAVGKAKAMDLILTGRMMDAAEAEKSGLVARVVPAASLMDEAMKVAETIANMSLPSVLAGKEAINRAFESRLGGRRGVRAAHLPCAVRDARSEGRHEGLRREAASRSGRINNAPRSAVCPRKRASSNHRHVACTGSPLRRDDRDYFLTQIILTTDALASPIASAPSDVMRGEETADGLGADQPHRRRGRPRCWRARHGAFPSCRGSGPARRARRRRKIPPSAPAGAVRSRCRRSAAP